MRTLITRPSLKHVLALVLTTFLAAADPLPAFAGESHGFNIAVTDPSAAVREFGKQSGVQILVSGELLKGKKLNAVSGKHSTDDALKILLADSGLMHRYVGERGVVLVPVEKADRPAADVVGSQSVRMARAEEASRAMQKVTPAQKPEINENSPDESAAEDAKGIPEILVKGKKSLNTDIQRTEDAPQPYVVFDREEIQRSQAINLEEFLRTRLPMNTASTSYSQSLDPAGNPAQRQLTGGSLTVSSINLRGLGSNQTLILIDGRRVPGVAVSNRPGQPDINGIPLAAVERIEVLPSTAGGIYGGSATGGVINIILRRDYQGFEAKATYANTFDADATSVRLDASAGFSLEDGRTHVMIAAAYSDANTLTIGDRDFSARAIALQLKNNPSAVINGEPPLGATANIRSTSFVNDIRQNLMLKLEYGGTDLGSAITYIPLGYAGPNSDNGAALVVNAGQYNLGMPGGVLGRDRGLVSAPSMESIALNLHREFGERLEAFLDFSKLGNDGRSFIAYSVPYNRTLFASAPTNPFQQDIRVTFPTPGLQFESRSKATTVRATGGLIVRLPQDWMGEVDYGWSRLRVQTSSVSNVLDREGNRSLTFGLPAPDGRPALNMLQEGNVFPIDFSPYLLPTPNWLQGPFNTVLKDATLRVSGPIFNLPGGALNVSALIEHREEGMQDAFDQNIDFITRAPTYVFYPHRSQEADSYYLEARVPLISLSNARPLVRELEMQVSVRRDEYKTTSDPNFFIPVTSRDGPFPSVNYNTSRVESASYTLGLRYAPLTDVTLRASFGTGFLPPSVTQISASLVPFDFSIGLIDPKRGNQDSYVGAPWSYLYGGNPTLKPEQSESWSVGVILTPRFASRFRLSIDYTKIEKIDEIQAPDAQFILDNEDFFPGRVLRGAALPGDPPGWAGPITSFDTTVINIAKTSVDAFDSQVDYVLETERFGTFNWYLVATWQPHYKNQLLPTASVVDSVGFTDGPLKWRGNLGVNWAKGPVTLSYNTQYYDSYLAYSASSSASSAAATVLNQGSATIPSQMYHDLVATYRFDHAASIAGGLLANSEVSLGIQNIFDQSPPILASTNPANAGYSTYGDPRLRRYSVALRKSFGK